MNQKQLWEQTQVLRDNNQRSLRHLCELFLSTTHWSGVHSELAEFLKTAGNRIHIELPRGHLKSWIVTQGWTLQQMLKNPDIRILIVNAVESNATRMIRMISQKFLGNGSLLSQIYGSFESDIWNQEEFVIKQRTKALVAPTYMGAGIQKTLTSQHFDIIIADDLVEPDNVRTPEQRQKVYEFYLSLFDLLEPDGRIVVIGTRYHQDDLYARILEENKEHGNWSVFVRSCYKPDGSVIFPEKFSKAQLDDIKKKDFYHFSTQYLNNPLDAENADFKSTQIRYFDPGTPHPGSLYLTIDPALSLGADADYTAMIVSGMYADRKIRVVDYFHKRVIPSDLVNAVFEMVAKWKLHRIGIETFAFQKTLKYEIERQQRERGIFFSIDELGKRHAGKGEQVLSKEARIRRLQPYFEQGLVEIRRDMQELRDELLAFPRGRRDDLCFSGNTLIATDRGDVCIKDVTLADKVLTPLGWSPVLTSRYTGRADTGPFFGTRITPAHKVFASGDFKRFDTLTYRDDLSKLSLCELYRWAYRKKLNSTGSATALWGRESITSAWAVLAKSEGALKDFTSRFGNFIRERKFHAAGMFITGMAIPSITTTKIWSVYRLGSIKESLKKSIAKPCVKILNAFDRLPLFGTGLKRVVDGIARTLKNSGLMLSPFLSPVFSAGNNLTPSCGMRSIAQGTVLRSDAKNQESTTSRGIAFSVEKVSRQTNTQEWSLVHSPVEEKESGRQDVYNLRVEAGCYYANGVLVSNCDALSYQLDYLVPSLEKSSASADSKHGSMDWWLSKIPEPKQSVYDRFMQDLRYK